MEYFSIEAQKKDSKVIDKQLLEKLTIKNYYSNSPINIGDQLLIGLIETVTNELKIITFNINEINIIYEIISDNLFLPLLKIKN